MLQISSRSALDAKVLRKKSSRGTTVSLPPGFTVSSRKRSKLFVVGLATMSKYFQFFMFCHFSKEVTFFL